MRVTPAVTALPFLLALGLAACDVPPVSGCPGPNDPTTYASFMTPPCPDHGTAIGWAEVEGEFRSAAGAPFRGRPIEIQCPAEDRDATEPMAAAAIQTRRDGSFHTMLALRMMDSEHPGDDTDADSPPTLPVTMECLFSSGHQPLMRDSIRFVADFSRTEPRFVEVVWAP